jgi:hypothetical protein
MGLIRPHGSKYKHQPLVWDIYTSPPIGMGQTMAEHLTC